MDQTLHCTALVCCQDQSTVLLLLLSHQPVHSGVVLTTHQCSAVEGLVHSPAHSHQTPLTSHCTRILQELHSQGNSCTHVLSVDRASVCRLRVSDMQVYKPHAVDDKLP